MAFTSRDSEKQVRLTVFDNESMARLAEQRLQQAGIPCFIRSLRGGPGLWGSAYNLPQDLYVYAVDEATAREMLELPAEGSDEQGTALLQRRSYSNLQVTLAGIILVALVIAILVSVLSKSG